MFTAAALPAFATTITFDELPGKLTQIPNGYAGLNWNNFSSVSGFEFNPSGFRAGIVSPDNVAFNAFGGPAVVSNSPFDLDSGYLTAAWNDGLNVRVIGSRSGSAIYDTTYILSATAPMLINFNYLGVDSVEFISSGGTRHPGYANDGLQFALDDMVVNVPGSFSTPDSGGTATLLGLGLSGLALLRRKLNCAYSS